MENSIPEICMRIIQWQFDSSSIQTFTIGNAMKANHENDNDKSIETLCWSNINSFIFQVPLILNATARFDDIRTISALEFDVYFMTSFLLSFFLWHISIAKWMHWSDISECIPVSDLERPASQIFTYSPLKRTRCVGERVCVHLALCLCVLQ